MLSPETTAKLDTLYREQNTYRPNSGIEQVLRGKEILMFVGATCEGKNTIMEAVAEQDPRFKIVGTLTSRDPRDSDTTPYTYYPHTDEGLRELLARIDRHDVVQYAINPHTHHIYGSELDDYFSEYNMGDVFASAVEGFRQLGFRRALAFTIITAPDPWLHRFNDRFPLGHPLRAARRDEAVESFQWSLAQAGANHYWIENTDGRPEIAAAEIIQVASHASNGMPSARVLAEASLKAALTLEA
jgi:guanylate kinase